MSHQLVLGVVANPDPLGNLVLPLSIAGSAVVGLFSLPAVFALLAQIRNRTPKDNFYQDVDGTSTPEAVASFSNKWPKVAILLLSLTSFGPSLALSVLSSLRLKEDDLFVPNWLITAALATIAIQAICIFAHRSSVKSHDLGIWAFHSTWLSTAVLILQSLHALQLGASKNDPVFILRLVSLGATIPLIFATISIPRRPDIFHNDKPVDAQFTGSVLSRYTWSWGEPIAKLAAKKGDLDEKDVPGPDHNFRARDLVNEWRSFEFKGTLLKNLLRAYLPLFLFQWSITVARSVVGLGPFWAMLRVIELLERRSEERPMGQILAYILSLAIFSLLGQWMQGWVNWFSMYKTSIPLRGQLSALIFEKSLKRKNVKMAEKEPSKTDDDEAEGQKDDKKSEEEDTVLKSRQAIVNLVGVDVRHVSNLAAFQFFIISSFANLFVYCGFLLKLIGFFPFAAGILAWALVLPINTYFTKKYMKCQAKLMKDRDAKLAIVNEALLGMRQIKFSALESQWEKRIQEMREQELTTLKNTFIADSVLFACWVISPIFLAAASLVVYAVLHGDLSPSIAFVSISIFKSLEVTLGALPELLTTSVDSLVSIKRIDTYLSGPEMKRIVADGPDVAFDNATVSWPVDTETPDEDRFILKNVNLSFPAGELSVISGKTGTGKSLLLSAILGEVDLLGGAIYAPPTAAPLERNDHKAHPGNWILPGSIAYVAQTPWLESASFRDNILFGLPFDEPRYQKVLEICALKKDLEILPDGDKTELGANGINLSGGQKWRVTLARAIYSRAEILVMDDIFSAVDAHVGRHIFEKCITGDICQGRTRILVTHHVALVQSKAKYLVELGEGTVLAAGLTSELAEDGTLERIKTHEQAPEEIQREEAAAEASTAVNSEHASLTGADGISTESTVEGEPAKDKAAKDFIEKETRDKGQVKSRIYLTYLRHSGGWLFWIVLALLFTSFEVSNLARNWWVKIWTAGSQSQVDVMHAFEAEQKHGLAYGLTLEHSPFHVTTSNLLNTQSAEHGLTYYLLIYVALSGASAVLGTVRFVWSFFMSIRASRTLFNQILFTVLRTPLRWLDTVPVGRILNRLTSDFDIIDNRLNLDFGMVLWRGLGLVGICVAAALVSPYILPMAFVLVFFATSVATRYMAGARPMKRLESTSKSPVFEQFNATLSGVATLRAYQKTQVYVDRMHGHLDAWDSVSIYGALFNRWMAFRMALIGTAFSSIVGIVVALSPYIDAAMAGFTLAFAVDFSGNILMTLWVYTNLELDMNATERVVEYADLKTEPLGGEKTSAAWPTSGDIEVKDLEVGYADDLPAVLKGVSFNVKNNERVGVIGRTGAGKSSLTLALFRFLEARSGNILIDGVDISKIDLHSLRSKLAIIPQDPVLFSGSVRSNLDPFNERTDEELRESLHRVHLVDSQPVTPANEPSSAAVSTASPVNANIFRDLSSGIAESGGNLSQGQRQLLCMARAIVSRPKIMVLDEATSAVDMATDTLIQRSIREEFTDSTLIVIAHRLSTIADFDRILVLSEGTVAEFGTPKELWETEGSIFRDMCEHSGEKDKLRETILGK
ncbi:P-loop containing nucleoside triphosphate hydrolase protein [Trichoderma sp. SZMC 28013]